VRADLELLPSFSMCDDRITQNFSIAAASDVTPVIESPLESP
jgi:hypothetical protein